MEMSLNMKSAS